jgi:dihydrofolate reductase
VGGVADFGKATSKSFGSVFMRKIVATEYLTLDGVFEEPGQWSFDYWSDEASKFKFDELFESDAMLLGRLTYEGFADRMNGMPKYVVSTTLQKADWNNSTIINSNIPDEVAKLKQQEGMNILVAGSGQLLQTLMEHDLVDEYRFMVHPLILGSGKRLFKDGIDTTKLQLTDTKTFASGIVILTYSPARNE